MLLTRLPRATKAIVFAAAVFVTVLAALHLNGPTWRTSPGTQPFAYEPADGLVSHDTTGSVSAAQQPADPVDSPHQLPCQGLTGGDDVLVVMRTGATEVKDKLPVHLNTTFQCYKHLAIFSDYAETFEGYQIHDVLADIAEDIKTTHEDFSHYQHVLQVGRENLATEELSGKVSLESGPVGKNDNAGWRLDKWKFLPMLNATYEMYPNMNWYVFVEPDTYVVWSNMLQWLSTMDPSKPAYFGSEVMIGDDIFAHGGSAFVLSSAALKIGAESYRQHTRDLWDYTGGHWAGDCVLGVTLHDAGVDLTWSWPMFQGGNPSLMDWTEDKGEDRRLWCLPALSYHHLNPDEKRHLFEFEQDWIKKHHLGSIWKDSSEQILHHRDLYKTYVRPQLESEKQDWNNFPETTLTEMTFHECREHCERDSTCIQYAVDAEGRCAIGTQFRLGQAQTGVHSGWIVERVDMWAANLDDYCSGKNSWTVP
ncbi:hypothetical protein CB0940_01793 [Cercospora beticola]|uniref:Glycosyltransferase family 31 protein n=1 Tax=Cercospora beticola TaxID=122368 RepID=A0A2G5I9F9_CERBT|nr:hypothetical protein CB0940_01793 [Cercospora beticola]PIB01431.1 hypothetical protein CB0940_01793 [Cercospora beticola]WPA97243.1 hypothetical protein RHO25_001852 [Cercospora beticola]